MGNPDTLTQGARRAIAEAELVVGAKRMLAALPPEARGERAEAIAPAAIAAILAAHPDCRRAAVVMSGDTGFYSGAAGLLPLLPEGAEVLCGVTTVQYLAARLRRPWQNAALYSAHGQDCDAVGSVLAARESFFLTGGKTTAQSLLRELTDAGLGGAEAAVGENLSYPDEAVRVGTAAELAEYSFAPLSAVWITRPELPPRRARAGARPPSSARCCAPCSAAGCARPPSNAGRTISIRCFTARCWARRAAISISISRRRRPSAPCWRAGRRAATSPCSRA
jgi:precorrin-6Y C5,15-methyltransferase (decarboxylating)